ncbi:hypothetical protein KAR91_27120 [Candidatus Pacearchaeota archaeon]|nr:hypothetical protein [Candidatus Pacearchaeota archaeon]
MLKGLNLDIWSIGHLQNFTTILNQFKAAGVTDITEIMGRIDLETSGRIPKTEFPPPDHKQKKKVKKKEAIFTKCSECGGVAEVLEVNVSKCTRVGGGWKLAIQCTECLKIEFKK